MAVISEHPQREKHITDKLGEVLKAFRLKQGYTREQLSERTGVNVRYIAAIENEGQLPRIPILCDLIRGLGLSADRIFYPEREQEDPDLDQLIRLIQLCNEQDRKVVSAVVNALVDGKSQNNDHV